VNAASINSINKSIYLNCNVLQIGAGVNRSSDRRRFRLGFGDEASDAGLELAVLGGVDERVDAAVGEHENHGEVVEPAGEVHSVADEADEDEDLVRRPADDETAADDQ